MPPIALSRFYNNYFFIVSLNFLSSLQLQTASSPFFIGSHLPIFYYINLISYYTHCIFLQSFYNVFLQFLKEPLTINIIYPRRLFYTMYILLITFFISRVFICLLFTKQTPSFYFLIYFLSFSPYFSCPRCSSRQIPFFYYTIRPFLGYL